MCVETSIQSKLSFPGKVAKIRNRYNQVPHLTQDTNGKVTNSQKTPQTRAKRSALSQQVTTKAKFPIFKNRPHLSVTSIALNDVNVRGDNVIKQIAREIGSVKNLYRYSR